MATGVTSLTVVWKIEKKFDTKTRLGAGVHFICENQNCEM